MVPSKNTYQKIQLKLEQPRNVWPFLLCQGFSARKVRNLDWQASSVKGQIKP